MNKETEKRIAELKIEIERNNTALSALNKAIEPRKEELKNLIKERNNVIGKITVKEKELLDIYEKIVDEEITKFDTKAYDTISTWPMKSADNDADIKKTFVNKANDNKNKDITGANISSIDALLDKMLESKKKFDDQLREILERGKK